MASRKRHAPVRFYPGQQIRVSFNLSVDRLKMLDKIAKLYGTDRETVLNFFVESCLNSIVKAEFSGQSMDKSLEEAAGISPENYRASQVTTNG